MKAIIFDKHGGPEVLKYADFRPRRLGRGRCW